MRATFLLFKDLQAELKTQLKTRLFDLPPAENSIAPKERICEPNFFSEPNILIGHIPPKKSLPKDAPPQPTDREAPFILIRPTKAAVVTDNAKVRTHNIKVSFLCCAYSKDSFEEIEAGYNDIANMVDFVLYTLNSKMFWEENHWNIKDDVEWIMGLPKDLSSVYEAGLQTHPFYGAAVTATFSAAYLHKPNMITA